MNPTDAMIQQPLEKVKTPIGKSMRLWCSKCHAEGRQAAYNQLALDTGAGYAVDVICPRCGSSSIPWHLIPPSSQVVLMAGRFPSQSIEGRSYEAKVYEDGQLYCTCLGFHTTRRCWHLNALKDAIKEDGQAELAAAKQQYEEGRETYYREMECAYDTRAQVWNGQNWTRHYDEPVGGLRKWS